MTQPDARKHHDPKPKRMRRLVAMTGLTQPQLAERLGCGLRSLERWLSDTDARLMPYPEQYLLEVLAAQAAKAKAGHHKPMVREPPPPKPKPHPFAALLNRKDPPNG